jgi:hypothetical protein
MKVPRMSRVERRQLIRLGRRSDDPYTALRLDGDEHEAAQSRRGARLGDEEVVPAVNR